MIYWTKQEFALDEETGVLVPTGNLIPVQQSSEDYVPDGDGFAVELGDKISYSSYKKNPEAYEIVNGVVVKKTEPEEEVGEDAE